jgi:beta-lactamase regulating signal transducer with metallopeptidase domain/protocatechuate 3,4-dioxygenase beta subunit
MTWQFLAFGPWNAAGMILNGAVQSTVLLAVALLAGRLLRRRGPAVQSALYRTTLVAVILCPVASMTMAAVGFNGVLIRLPAPEVTGASVRMSPPSDPAPRPARVGDEPIADRVLGSSSPTNQVPIPATLPLIPSVPVTERPVTSPTVSIEPSPVGSDARSRRRDWIGGVGALLLAAWLLGVAVLGLRLLLGHRRMRELRSGAIAAEPDALALCGDIARRLSLIPPPVLRTPFLSSPCLDGVRKPAILLPEDAEENLRETFVHELAHLARRDGMWNLLRQAATAVFWVQPLLWLLSKRLEATAEEVCDDYVVAFGADRGRYAGLLLELAERRLPPLAPAGVGMISLRSLLARRITRILDSTRALSTRAGRRAIAATLVGGLAGTLLVGLINVGTDRSTVLADEPKARMPAPADGPSPTPAQEPAPSKSAPAARSTPTPSEKAVGVPITGRIVDLEGRPVVGVTVQVRQISRPKGENLDAWIEAARQGAEPWIAYKHLDSEPSTKGEDKLPPAITDAQGRFRVDGIGAERLVDLAIKGPTIAYTRMMVVTRRMESVAAPGFASHYGPGSQTIHGADFIHTASPGRPVEGIVRDAKTKQPLANVEIRSNCFAGTNWVGTQDLKVTTDTQGRFRLVGMPKGQGNGLILVPNDDQPYFMQEASLPDPPGVEPVSLEIALHRGIWIEGKVTDQETGSPVPGCRLQYFPFLDNPFAGVTPEFDKNNRSMSAGFAIQDRYQTRADGSYRLVGLSGRALVGVISSAKKPYLQGAGSESIQGMDAHGHFPTYRNPIDPGRHWPTSLKEINPPEGTEAVHLDFALLPGAKVRVRAVDPAGKPVTGLSLAGRTQRGHHEWNVKHEAEFDVVTLAPGEDRMVLVIQEERKLGRAFHAKPGDDKDGPVTVTLEPLATITGRVTDADGSSVSGASIRTDPLPGGDFSLSLASRIASDHKGKFVVPNVPTGCNYSVAVESGTGRNHRFTFFQNAAVRPGEITDVGDIAFKND